MHTLEVGKPYFPVTLSPAFTRKLHAAIAAQAGAAWNPASYDAYLAEAYRRYPTSAAMLNAGIARCRGGA